jgi:hypothetical protein
MHIFGPVSMNRLIRDWPNLSTNRSKMDKMTHREFFKLIFVFVLLLSGCRQSEPAANPATAAPAIPIPSSPLTEAFPGDGSIEGWTTEGELEVFGRETIFHLVNGQADFFFLYGFDQVAVQRYKNVEEVILDIHIWQLSDDTNAFGLFTSSIAGEPAAIGNESDTDPGRRLIFWQDRYVAQLFSRKEIPNADLRAFGNALSAALPSGGEKPALVDQLPAEGLIPRSEVFFHEELSIQNELWLGGENILGLSQDTNGVVASYDLADSETLLLLIEYPAPNQAATGVEALQTAQVDDLVIAQSQDNLLAAVFGEVNADEAQVLLQEVLR